MARSLKRYTRMWRRLDARLADPKWNPPPRKKRRRQQWGSTPTNSPARSAGTYHNRQARSS